MESLSNARNGEVCTIKWMFGAPGVMEWLDAHNIREGSCVRVIQNTIGDLILGIGSRRVVVGREIAERIKV